MPEGYLVPGPLLEKLARQAARTAAGEFEETVPGQWQVGPEPAAIRRFHLTADLPPCGNAAIYFYDETKTFLIGPDGNPEPDTLHDPLGIGKASTLARPDGTVPSGTDGYCALMLISDGVAHWEPLAFGVCGSSSSSSSPSQSSPSQSSPSPSSPPPSSSTPSSSTPSSSTPSSSTPSSSTPSSPSPSQSSQPSSPSPSQSSQPPSSGQSKSSAIVPAPWSPGGYTALFVVEAPEVLFDDVMVVRTAEADARFPIDARFLAVCEPGSVHCSGCTPDAPLAVGAKVAGGAVRVRIKKDDPAEVVELVIRLTGVRKGFAGMRFPDRTAEQFAANERFIRSAYA